MSKKAEKHNSSAHDTATTISRHKQDVAFDKTLKQARSHMNHVERIFSQIIHLRVVEWISDVIGGSLARPNTILYGSSTALILTLTIYLTAKYFGYPLSGAESIASFIVGWGVGATIDYTHMLIRGGRAKNKR